jgi:hypothetical protein
MMTTGILRLSAFLPANRKEKSLPEICRLKFKTMSETGESLEVIP